MRHRCLAMAAMSLACMLSLSAQETVPAETRLLGTWMSDRETTLKHLKTREDATPERRDRIRNLFGRLRITFAPGEMHTEMDGVRDSGPYEVVASDRHSIVLRVRDWDGQPKLIQIHFVETGYCVLSYGFVEYFKRVDPWSVIP